MERIVFLTTGVATSRQTFIYQEKKNPNTDLIPFIKINSKWITGLNVKLKIINLLEQEKIYNR